MSDTTRILAGILLLSLVTVEIGGLYLVRLVQGAAPATPFQLGFARAGHAHAAVLLVLSLTALLYADAVHLTGPWGWLSRVGVPAAALRPVVREPAAAAPPTQPAGGAPSPGTAGSSASAKP